MGIVLKKKTAPGSLSTGSPAGRTLPHGDGSMYNQANVRIGKCAAAPYPSVAVRDRGHWEGVAGSGWAHRSARSRGQQCVVGGKLFAPGCASKPDGESRGGARRTQAKGKTSRSKEIDDKRLHKELCSSDGTGKPVKLSEDIRVMHAHDGTGEPVKSNANTHTHTHTV